MAHHARVRASGAWVTVSPVDPSEFELLDQNVFESINGDEGGTWAPSAVIAIGGSGLTVSGPLTASDARNHTFASPYKIRFNDDVSLAAGIELGEFRSLEVGNEAQIRVGNGGAVTVQSSGEFVAESGSFSNFESGSNFTLESGCVANSQAVFNHQNAVLRTGATARSLTASRNFSATNTNTLAGVEYDVITMNVTGATNITLTLKIATAPIPSIGEEIKIRKLGVGAGGLTLKNEGSAANLATWAATTGNTVVWFDGTMWRLVADPINGTAGADAG